MVQLEISDKFNTGILDIFWSISGNTHYEGFEEKSYGIVGCISLYRNICPGIWTLKSNIFHLLAILGDRSPRLLLSLWFRSLNIVILTGPTQSTFLPIFMIIIIINMRNKIMINNSSNNLNLRLCRGPTFIPGARMLVRQRRRTFAFWCWRRW